MCDEFRSWPEMRSAVTRLHLDVCVCVCVLVSFISFKIDESIILDFRKQRFATLKQPSRWNQFRVSFSASSLVFVCVCKLTHLIVYSDAGVHRQTLTCICVSLCTCVGVLLNSKGYSYHKKKGDLMSKHLACLSVPLMSARGVAYSR